MQRRVLTGAAVFAVMGFVGPVLDYLLPYSAAEESSYFVYRLITFLWPTRLLGLMLLPVEARVGYHAAVAVGVTVNIALWAILGAMAGAASMHRSASWALQVLVSGALAALLVFLVKAPEALEALSLVTAWLLYAIPFTVVRRHAARVTVEAP